MIRAIFTAIGLWIGTWAYYLIFAPHTLAVQVIDACWFEFVGCAAMAFIGDMRGWKGE